MKTDDRTLARAQSDLNFALKDIKAAKGMDAVQRTDYVREALGRIKGVVTAIEGEAKAS